MAQLWQRSLRACCVAALAFGLTGCWNQDEQGGAPASPSGSAAASPSSPSASPSDEPAIASPEASASPDPALSSPEASPSEAASPSPSEDILETGARKDAAEKLLAEFRKHDDKMQNAEGTKEDWVLAVDSAKGLAQFKLRGDLANEISRLKKSYEQDLKYSTIYSGYTASGLHVVAIAQPASDSSEVYKDAMDTVRGTGREWDYLSAFVNPEDDRDPVYYAVDVKVEGLVKPAASYKVGIQIAAYGLPLGLIDKPADNDTFAAIAKKYGRTLVSPDEPIKDGEWRTYLFDSTTDKPDITVQVEGESIALTP